MKRLVSLILMVMMLVPFALAEGVTTDRAGNPITLPDDPQKVVCLNSAVAETISDLGLTDRVIAVDTNSPLYVPAYASLPQFDMMAPDIEQIAALEPDLVIITSMSFVDGSNPYQALMDMGVCVAVVPSSGSIADIQSDILFVAQMFHQQEAGQALVDQMQAKIDEITAIGSTITEKKSVFFEVGALPYLYSTGTGTFIDEMINLIGATNSMGEQASWISVTEEAAIAANPDVILTNINYIEDPVGEILSRPGWENVTAVAQKQVYQIDNQASSLADAHIVKALIQMAQAVYPETYAGISE